MSLERLPDMEWEGGGDDQRNVLATSHTLNTKPSTLNPKPANRVFSSLAYVSEDIHPGK